MSTALDDLQEFAAILKVLPPSDKARVIGELHRMLDEHDAVDTVWGIAGIAAFIGRTPRQTYEALAKGELPARRVNRRWCASKSRLREFFREVAA